MTPEYLTLRWQEPDPPDLTEITHIVVRTKAVSEPVIDEWTGEEYKPWAAGDQVEVYPASTT